MSDIPVSLIQELHARRDALQAELEAIAAMLAREASLHGELHDITTLLERYPLLPRAKDVPQPSLASLCDEASPPSPPLTMMEHVDTLFQEHGSLSVTALLRLLRTQGCAIDQATLTDHLEYGRQQERYVKTQKAWRLPSTKEAKGVA